MKESPLLGLAEQLGKELSPTGARWKALRQSSLRKPDPELLHQSSFNEPHLRGEILVAAILNAFAEIWERRIKDFDDQVPLRRISEEGAKAAEHLLNICIRALDYCPPVDVEFGDYLSGLLTADIELVPYDKYNYRSILIKSFEEWGIIPASKGNKSPEVGIWLKDYDVKNLITDRVHFESLQRDEDEIFKYLWENRKELDIYDGAYSSVNWVRPCVRLGPDGFVLHETIAEYIQMIDVKVDDLVRFDLIKDKDKAILDGLPSDAVIRLYGGGTFVFDEFGHLKYHIHKDVMNSARQTAKIRYWVENEMYDSIDRLGFTNFLTSNPFARWHRTRVSGLPDLKGGD